MKVNTCQLAVETVSEFGDFKTTVLNMLENPGFDCIRYLIGNFKDDSRPSFNDSSSNKSDGGINNYETRNDPRTTS
ncbi:hypothetical protein BaRGS_00026152, partial [Batillaria attramentaria]